MSFFFFIGIILSLTAQPVAVILTFLLRIKILGIVYIGIIIAALAGKIVIWHVIHGILWGIVSKGIINGFVDEYLSAK